MSTVLTDFSDDSSFNNGEFPPGLALRYNWLTPCEAQGLMTRLLSDVTWSSESIRLFGKWVPVPRKVAWYGDKQAYYRYSGVAHQPLPWIEPLLNLKQMLESDLSSSFNSVLCNLYRTGHDSMGWHSDNEKELGDQPVIASISLGASRRFDCRGKDKPKKSCRFELPSGSLLIMFGKFQSLWQHQIPKQTRIVEPRINLTFRLVIENKPIVCE